MVESIINTLLKQGSQFGMASVFLTLTVLVFYYLRKDSEEHRKEYKEVISQMFKIVEKNTEANQRLADTIGDLKAKL